MYDARIREIQSANASKTMDSIGQINKNIIDNTDKLIKQFS